LPKFDAAVFLGRDREIFCMGEKMEHAFVSAGDYLIESVGKKKIIEVLLLTCVGVAMYDRVAKIGGVCHILLPDSPHDEHDWQPKSYASSCLALFVQDLIKGGAEPGRLEAVVAGGALGLPFSQYDVNLDIGGRICACVYRFLQRHDIAVKKSATGGCSGMKIVVRTDNWRVDIIHFTQLENRAQEISKPSPEQIREAIINTKPIPQIAIKLIRLLHEGDYDMHEIAEELSHDQVLSAKVISYCNSAFMGQARRIDSVTRATLVLGEIRLLEIVISAALRDFFEKQVGGYSLLKGGLFKHSLAVAHLTKIIAGRIEDLDAQTAYTAGLLHDIGKVVLDQYVADSRPLFYNMPHDERIDDMIMVERETFATDHQEVGRQLAAIWNLPDSLGEAVSLHHEPERAVQYGDLVHAVYLADLLATWFMAGVELEKINTANLVMRMKRLDLGVADIPEVVSQAPWKEMMYL
jgi:putative nucleotidyltransferase with HDIG domain